MITKLYPHHQVMKNLDWKIIQVQNKREIQVTMRTIIWVSEDL